MSPPKLNGRGRVTEWLRERLAVDFIREFLRHKTVPRHSGSIWYYLGGMTLFFFVIQVLSGTLLLLYYRPTPEQAYESVAFIMTEVHFGWLIRSVHAWSANLMVVTALGHMFSVAFLHSYRRPREITWLSGIILLALTLAFGFTGYLLPWNQLAYFATRVGTDMAEQLPFIGSFLGEVLKGGDQVSGATLTRFFGIHVAILPGLTTLLLLVHLGLVQQFGISAPPRVEREYASGNREIPRMPFFPNFFLRELVAWYAALGALGALAALLPWELGERADPFASAPAGIRPEWYFLAPYYTLKLIPAHVWVFEGEVLGLLAMLLLAIWWSLLPFWAVSREGFLRTRWVTGAGVALLAYLIAFSALGYWA